MWNGLNFAVISGLLRSILFWFNKVKVALVARCAVFAAIVGQTKKRVGLDKTSSSGFCE